LKIKLSWIIIIWWVQCFLTSCHLILRCHLRFTWILNLVNHFSKLESLFVLNVPNDSFQNVRINSRPILLRPYKYLYDVWATYGHTRSFTELFILFFFFYYGALNHTVVYRSRTLYQAHCYIGRLAIIALEIHFNQSFTAETSLFFILNGKSIDYI